MDFGEILDEWERIKRERAARAAGSSPSRAEAAGKGDEERKARAFRAWLDASEIGDKDAEAGSKADREAQSRRLAAMRPQATLDLHGMGAQEASAAIAAFIEEASRAGLEKVLIIHGKGLHSASSPVLKRTTREVLESLRLAGRFGQADKADGGSGAMWVRVRPGR